MPGCCAPNCANSFRKGFRLFSFPRQVERKKRWLINCRWDKWKPSRWSRLCEVHFEPNQFEANRQDGRRLLKHNAVPTIFDVPNAPKRLEIQRPLPTKRVLTEVERLPVVSSVTAKAEVISNTKCNAEHIVTEHKPLSEIEILKKDNLRLRKELRKLKKREQIFMDRLGKFLREDQVQALTRALPGTMQWTEETVMDCLNMALILGCKGYDFLRKNGYPLPSRCTLSRWAKANNCDPSSLNAELESNQSDCALDQSTNHESSICDFIMS